MKEKIIISIVVFIGLSVTNLFGQKYLPKANAAFLAKQYHTAISLYKEAYGRAKDNKTKAEIVFKTAECYRLMNNLKIAELWYYKCIKSRYPEPIIYLHYADALKCQGRYDEAIEQYKIYKELKPEDPAGEEGIKSCRLALKWKENPTRYIVENIYQLNTKYDEYAPAYSDKQYSSLYITSNREGVITKGTFIDEWTGQNFPDIFYSKVDKKGLWSTPVQLSESINTPLYDGSCQLDAKKNTIYLTRYIFSKYKLIGSRIFYATKKGQDFASSEPLSIPNLTDSTFAFQPSISNDNLSLYFSAELPGGYGGKDIWVVVRKGEKDHWEEEPINLGKDINTAKDEIFPFICSDGKILYFSSNGHGGMGGFDIYKTEKIGNDPSKFAPPINLMYPLNSEGDDLGFIIEEKQQKGFLSSNRQGGQGGYDIYSFVLPPLEFTIQGVVKDKNTKAVISNAFVKLTGSDGSSAETKTDSDGMYKFSKSQIRPNTSYKLTVGHYNEQNEEDYYQSIKETTTVGIEENTDLMLDFELSPLPIVIKTPE